LIILRNRQFGLLWLAQLVSTTGDWLMVIAVPVFVYQLTGSPMGTAAAFLAEVLPALLLAPIAGVFADRWDRRTVMVVTNLLRAGVISLLILVDSPGMLWLLLLLVFAESSVSQFFYPAHRAILPQIVGRGKDLDSANAWYAVSRGVVRLVAAPLGGALYAMFGFTFLVMIDVGTYLAGALLVLAIQRPKPAATGPPSQEQPGSTPLRRFWHDFRVGIVFLIGHRVLRGLLAISMVFLMANGAINILVAPYVLDELDGGPEQFGILMSALGLGYLLSAYVGRVMAGSGRLRLSAVVCLAIAALSFAGLFNVPHLGSAIGSIALVGAAGGAILLVIQIQLQRLTPDEVLGRISSAFLASEMLATVIGAALGGLLAEVIGLVITANIAAGLIAVSVLLAILLLPRRIAVGDDGERVDGDRSGEVARR
jgi:MFS family permease